jgi:hypothetical protein
MIFASVAMMFCGVCVADPDSPNKTQTFMLLAIWFMLQAQMASKKKED